MNFYQPGQNLKKVFLVGVFLVFGSASSSFAEQKAALPEIQLVRIGNSLAAIDDSPLSSADGEVSVLAQAQSLEREIMVRKLSEQQKPEAGIPIQVAQPLPKMEAPSSASAVPVLSAISKGSFFKDADEEIVDPFRSGDNFDNWATRILHHFKYKIGVYGEYDDNIFLTKTHKFADWKAIVNQSVEMKYPMENFYLEALYAINLDIYTRADELVPTQNASGRLSYYPFEKLTMGVADQWNKVGASNVATNFGDQTLNLGYITNTLTTNTQYELWKNGFFEASWNFDHIDFDNDNVNLFINRDVHVIDFRLKHRFTPPFSNYFGYRYKDVQFPDFHFKDSESNIGFYGLSYEFPGLLTFFGEVGYEQKCFKHTGGSVTILPFNVTLPFKERRSEDGNVNYRLAIESNISRYNNISLSYESHLLESSRPEFTQYLSKTFAINSRRFLDSKTILFNSFYLEFQDFNAADAFSVLFSSGGARTEIVASGITLRRIITDWLYFDVGYTHVFRDTDFIGETSKNNRVRFGARATF